MKLSYDIPEPEPMLATPESVDSSSASPESGVLAAEVFVLDPSLCNENSPAREIKYVFQMSKLKNYTRYKFLVKTHFHTSRFEIQLLQYLTMHLLQIIGTGFYITSYSNNTILHS